MQKSFRLLAEYNLTKHEWPDVALRVNDNALFAMFVSVWVGPATCGGAYP